MKYFIPVEQTIYCSVQVEADSIEQAIEKVKNHEFEGIAEDYRYDSSPIFVNVDEVSAYNILN